MIRVVVAGVGLPGGEDPLAAMATALRHAGAEVIYAGWEQTTAQVVRSAVQEDAEAVGLCGATDAALQDVARLLAEQGADDITMFTPATEAEFIDNRLPGNP